jgi:hypothetical protein
MHPGALPKSAAAMGLAGGIGKLFSTHPRSKSASPPCKTHRLHRTPDLESLTLQQPLRGHAIV